jgi:uncharacterized protein
MSEEPFWRRKSIHQMSPQEWESLCDGCGKCCINKLEEEGTGRIFPTNVACKLLDPHSCQCADYKNRKKQVPDCIRLTPRKILELGWLPKTCGYVRVAEGKDLPSWHHLKTGTRETMHKLGKSVRGRVVSETVVTDLEDHIVKWKW